MSYQHTVEVLKRLANLEHQIVLVGGQAVNFWANYYKNKAPQLAAYAPYTSKDIDFVGPKEAVRECAKRLGGTAKLATFDDVNTPNTGVVMFIDSENHARHIDFLGSVAGVADAELIETAASARLEDEEGCPVASFLIINPVLCLKSRVHNVAYLPGYQTEHARKQLRAAIICAKQFAADELETDPRKTLDCNEKIFDIARYGAGIEVFVHHRIDVLEAIVDAPGLPEKFYTERLPRARAAVKRARAKEFAAMERARVIAERKQTSR